MGRSAMDELPWDMEASLWIGREHYARGTLAELGFLLGDLTADRLRVAYIAGADLPIMYEGQPSHMMQQPGVNALRHRYLEERPHH
jgi:hypothetical protein